MGHIQTQEEWEVQMAEKILSYVRNELYLEMRYLDVAFSALVPQADASLQSFATDGGHLFYSTEQILRVFEKNAPYLNRAYLHTVLHCIFSHPWIAGNRDRRLWNLACDVAVEYTIDGLGKKCTKRILSWTRQKREFVIVIDTSYSTSGELVEQFLRETANILHQSDSFFARSVIRVLQCDNVVRSDAKITGEQEMEAFLRDFTLLGGGGTDFRPAFSYVNDLLEQGELKELAGLLYFTDGKGRYPAKRPDYRTAFLFLEDYDEAAVPPWAMRLLLEKEEFLN